jgi:hypothetical protein
MQQDLQESPGWNPALTAENPKESCGNRDGVTVAALRLKNQANGFF